MADFITLRSDEPAQEPVVTLESFGDQSNATAVRIEPGEDARELRLGADQRIDMLDRGDGFVLRGGGAADGDQRLARRIRDQMQMEIIADHGIPPA